MKPNPKLHKTKNCSRPIFGYELEPGDVLEKNDVYDSTSGDWERCPCPGLSVGEGSFAKWIRPINHD